MGGNEAFEAIFALTESKRQELSAKIDADRKSKREARSRKRCIASELTEIDPEEACQVMLAVTGAQRRASVER